jgi:uncharacterized protein (UPF0264 family)
MSNASLSAARIDAGESAADRPKLLVSVRSVEEARAAIDGGADVIDVKEPRRGSLGMADPDVIASVVKTVLSIDPGLPVSAALGELLDCESQLPCVTDGLNFAKMGLAGAAGLGNWAEHWHDVRCAIERQSRRPVQWVGVAYLDEENAGAPPVEEIVSEAAAAGCAGVLIDTFDKAAGSLLGFANRGELLRWTQRIHDAGMFVALAGRVAVGQLPALSDVPADVIAVRSAVCRAHRRDAELSSELVARFRRQLQQAFHSRHRRGFC